jgi:membrane associated rhomboid family serine protease
MKNRLHLSYNAPVTLTFSIICTLVLVICLYLPVKVFPAFFTAPSCQGTPTAFNWKSPFDYMRLFLYVFGHADWNHLLSNLSFIMLLGPLMEERYGSGMLFLMFLMTTFITGAINATCIPTPMHGASGIVFMLILLASFTTINRNEIPLSFIAVLAIYLGRELYAAPHTQNIATIAHIAGGLCGSLFGFLVSPRRRAEARKKTAGKRAASNDTVIADERF